MIHNIQALRFFAAMGVFMAHIAPSYSNMTASMGFFNYFTFFGQAGVDIFFAISGYIMWHSTRKLHGKTDSSFFLMNRFARIFTGYWPFFLLSFIFLYLIKPESLVEVDMLKSFLLIPQSMNKNLMIVTWTLFFELYFYIFMAVLILTSRKTALHLLWVVAFVFLIVNIYKSQTLSNTGLANFSYLQFFTSPYILEFLAGCFAWELIQRKILSPRLSIIAVILGITLITFGFWFNFHIMNGTIFYGYHNLYRISIFGTAAFLLVYGLVGIEKQGHIIRNKLWINLGDGSYALYLSHGLFILIFATYIKPFIHDRSVSLIWITSLGLILVTIIYSLIHFKLVEDPLHKEAKQLIKKLYIKNKS